LFLVFLLVLHLVFLLVLHLLFLGEFSTTK
jgi:hypothetical protein